MKAIRLTQQNRNTILQHSPIDPAHLDRMLAEYDTLVRDAAVYFVPQSSLAHSLTHDSWMTIPRQYLETNFKFDDAKIDREFVEVSQHGPIG